MAPARPTVLLFDIDGTLLDSGGAGRRAMLAAFAALHGRPDACEGFSFGGMTDRGIVRRALTAIGVAADDRAFDALIASYLSLLTHELTRSERATVLPGVVPLLDRLVAGPALAVGLGTGNVREGAELKLRRVGLHDRFTFGGFGCDAEERAELVRVGARRGAEALGQSVERCRVVVIGDTPRDVEAARGAGAACLAVATGPFRRDELASHSPDLLVDDLTDPRVHDFLVPR